MKNILLVLLLIMATNANAQYEAYKISIDPEDSGLIFNGHLTFTDLDSETTFTWMKSEAKDYQPDQKKIDILHFYLGQYTMVVFLGTWCDDSHTLIPKLEKVLRMAGYPESKLAIYGVDRSKTTINGEQKKYDVTNVPTIILFDGDREMGRITETVKTSVEADLANIILDDMKAQEPH